MRYESIKSVPDKEFKRLTGVNCSVFEAMVSELVRLKSAKRKGIIPGRPPKISPQDTILMLLMYYSKYRTFLHISKSYDISEMHCWRVITQTEKLLLQSEKFRLPGKKSLHKSENNFEIIVVDVSEHPVERPKKNSENIILAKRNATR